MDPPILDPLDPDPHFLWIRTQGTFLGRKYGDIYIIDQSSQNLGTFYRFFLGGRHVLNPSSFFNYDYWKCEIFSEP